MPSCGSVVSIRTGMTGVLVSTATFTSRRTIGDTLLVAE
jgi:hypothetical protein